MRKSSVSTPGISVVIPVYNSSAILPDLIEELRTALNELSLRYEIILVNDGSRDASWDEVRRLASMYGWIRGINLMRNYGQHNALLCGIRAASYDITVVMDDDLQHSPSQIGKLLEMLNHGYDVVYAVPKEGKHGLFRNAAAKVTKIALKGALGADTASKVSPYRMFRTSLREAFAAYHSSFVSVDVLLTWGTTRFGAVSVPYSTRRSGKSQYTFRKLITHALNMMTGFSTLPLQFAMLVGFGVMLFGVFVLAFVLARYFMHGTNVPGFTFLASVIIIFSGAQLFALGIFGEYLARIHFRMMERPPYVVASVTSDKNVDKNLI
jgi:undecaprenyl-phosphate 4-deoxy-4-formamido-L-arabinose transferase